MDKTAAGQADLTPASAQPAPCATDQPRNVHHGGHSRRAQRGATLAAEFDMDQGIKGRGSTIFRSGTV